MPQSKLSPKLGQNFLKSRQIARLMALRAVEGQAKADWKILEIGPGKGILTEELLRLGMSVVAIEKDRELALLIEKKFSNEVASKQLVVQVDDIMNLDMENGVLRYKPYKIVANIPYYITGAILKKFLSAKHQPTSMTLMVQREVAERIVGADKNESILSVSVKSYGTPSIIRKVSRKYFSPQPNVDSAILQINDISRKLFYKNEIDESAFFALVRAGFAHKRKLLVNSLKTTYPNPTPRLYSAGVPPNTRAETLSVKSWLRLAKSFASDKK